MSVMLTNAPTRREPSPREVIEGVAPIALAPAYFGPPVISILGPWLLLVLLLVGPAALLIVFVLAFVFLAAAFAALVALLASPYLLVRHLRARHRAPRRAFAFLRRPAAAPVVGERVPQATTRAPLAA
jgi:hypothetical protein